MNSPKLTRASQNSIQNSIQNSMPRKSSRLQRGILAMTALALLLGGAAFWLSPGQAAAQPHGLTGFSSELLHRASTGLRAAAVFSTTLLGFEPQSATANSLTISTIVGGGFATNVAVKQAPGVLPTAVARDPLGRGFYFIDETNNYTYLRFVNTSATPVTLAGTTVQPNSVNLIAGGGSLVLDGTPARSADLSPVSGLAVDPTGNAVYICTPFFFAIRAINVGAQNFSILGVNIAPSTIANVASIPTSVSDFRAITIHPTTHDFYFVGTAGTDSAVYRIASSSGTQTIYAGGGNPGAGSNGDGGGATGAKLVAASALAFDASGNLLIAEGGDTRNTPGAIRKVNTGSTISTLAGSLAYPNGIAISPSGQVYATLGNAQQIVSVSSNGTVTRVAGNQTSLVCDVNSNPTCGDGSTALNANFMFPGSSEAKSVLIAADSGGILIPDFNTHRVRYVNLSGATVTMAGVSIGSLKIDAVAGNGFAVPFDNMGATATEMISPTGVAADAQGNLYLSDTGDGNRLRFVNRGAAAITLFASTPWAQTVQPSQIITLNKDVGSSTEPNDGRINTMIFASPQGLAVTAQGVFIADSQNGVQYPATFTGKRTGIVRFLNTTASDVTILGVTVPAGMCATVAGQIQGTPKADINGPLDNVPATGSVVFPTDVAVDTSGNLYIADQGDNKIRKVSTAGTITTFYGNGTTATLNGPTGIAFDSAGRLHIADTKNNRVLRQDTAGGATFSIIADNSKGMSNPRDLTVNSSGQVFVTNAGTHRIMKIVAPSNGLGTASVAVGTGTAGFSGDGGSGPLAMLNLPNPLASTNVALTINIITLPSGDMVFADPNNNRLRLLTKPANTAPSLAAVSNQTMNEGGSLTVNFTGTDPENNALTFSLTGQPSFGALNDNGNGTASLQFTPGFSDSGTYNIGVIVSDGDLTATTSFTLTVNNANRAPVATADPISTPIEATSANGSLVHLNGSATDADGDAVTYKWFDGASQIATGATADVQLTIGNHSIFLMATDSNNASASTTAQPIVIRDTIKPVINSVPANQTLTANTLGGKAFTFTLPTATDNLDGTVAVVPSGVPANNIYPVGVTTLTLTATDSHGNAATAAFTVTVTDTTKPTISGVPADIIADATAPNGAVVNYTMPTATDPVDGSVTVTASKPPGSLFPFGLTVVTLTAKDPSNNTTTATFVVFVTDTTPPVISGVPANRTVEATSASGAVITYTMPTATDSVDGPVPVQTDKASGSVFPLGVTVVTFSADDTNNNSATASFIITVVDTTKPTISSAPANVTVEATSGSGAAVTYTMPTATDIVDGNVAVTTSKASGSIFPLGATTVTLTAKDAHNNTATASFIVTVADTTKPVMSGVPANQTIEADTLGGKAFTFTQPTATDIVDGAVTVMASGVPANNIYPPGTTTVTFTAKDARNNTATASFTITVTDTTPPTINGVPANITAEATAASGATVTYTMPTATDVVDGNVAVTADKPSGSIFPLGTTTVTFTAKDPSNNTATASFTITVVDTTKPGINGVPANLTAEATSGSGAAVNYTMPAATDAVDGNVAVTASKASGSVFPLGATTVTFTTTDAHGNAATASFTATVVDTTKPVISSVPANITAEGATVTGVLINYPMPTATDLVDGNVPVFADNPPGVLYPYGTTTVTLTATDAHGNRATASFTVTVADTTKPVMSGVPANITTQAISGSGTPITYTMPIAIDTVDGLVAVMASKSSGSAFPLGATIVTFTATDIHGNTATVSFTVTITDSTLPVISGVPANITAEATGAGGAAVTYTLPTATDPIDGNVPVTADKPSGSMFPLGTTAVTFTAKDPSNNNTTASFNITVVDTTKPSLNSIPAYITAEAAGPNGALVTYTLPTATDAVDGNVAVTPSKASGSVFPLGTTTVTFTTTDSHGNIATSSFNITVVDTTKPSLNGIPAYITAEATGPNGALVTYTLPIATDAVDGNVTVTTDNKPPGTLFPLGVTQVNFAAIDSHGNTATSSFNITVVDTTKPTINGVPTNITREATGASGATVTFTMPTAVDMVDGNVVVTSSRASGTVFPIGVTTVTFTATDAHNNKATTSFIVTVADTTKPTISGVPANITSEATGASGATVPYTMPTAIDTVGGNLAVSTSKASGTVFPIGATTVTFTATDGFSNAATASFTVTVVDTTKPSLSGVPGNQVFEGNTRGGRVFTFAPTAADTVQGVVTVNASGVPPGNLYPVGITTVTLTATDQSGNMTTASFTVTVTDTQAPVISGRPANINTEAASPTGAIVNYTMPAALDQVEGGITVTTDKASGTLFPLGTTTVHFTAADSRGNTATDSFTVSVYPEPVYSISTLAGNGSYGNTGNGGLATAATFKQLNALALDSSGGLLVLDTINRNIRRVDAQGKIAAFAGSSSSGNTGDTKAAILATFGSPSGLAADSQGNVYIADASFNRIRVVTPDGKIAHFAGDPNGNAGSLGDGGQAASARLRAPANLAVDSQNNLYIADTGNNLIRRVDAITKLISTVAGTGNGSYNGDNQLATLANLNGPQGVAVDAPGNIIIADTRNHRIRRVDAVTKQITTVAGTGAAGFSGDDGPAVAAMLNNPVGVTVDAQGHIFFADRDNNCMRRVSNVTGKIKTMAGQGTPGFGGDGGPAVNALLSQTLGVALDIAGNGYVADSGNLRVRKLTSANGSQPTNHAPVITSVIGNQTVTKSQSLDIALSATDEDSDSVTFTLINAPAFASIIATNPAQRTATLHLAPDTQTGAFANVQVQADDGKGGTATSAAFTITVNDTASNRPPVASAGTLPAVIEAASSAGAVIALNGSGTDPDNDTLTFSWKDNSTVIATSATASVALSLGSHSLTLTVSDGKGGSSTTTPQTVLVRDTTAPVLSGVPGNQTFEADARGGKLFTFNARSNDAVSGPVTVQVVGDTGNSRLPNDPISLFFPVGSWIVRLKATDAANNTSDASFTVIVTDTQGPLFSNVPANQTVAATSAEGAAVNYPLPTAMDVVDGPVMVTTDKASGTAFPVGSTTVHFTAVDTRGNTTAASFTVTVTPISGGGTEISYLISTMAGSGSYGNTGNGGLATAATFKQLAALALDNSGGLLVLDTASRTVRRVEANGKISLVAGSSSSGNTGDGKTAIMATFGAPSGIAADSQGNIYIADSTYNRIRVVTPDGKISHFAGDASGNSGSLGDGGPATGARFRAPTRLAVDSQNNLYIADTGNDVIRRVDAVTKLISTVAGTGSGGYNGDSRLATSAQLNSPSGLTVDAPGNILIADTRNHRIRRVDAVTKQITTVVGTGAAGYSGDEGPAVAAMLNNPADVAVDGQGNILVADQQNSRVRRVSSATGKIKTIAGQGAPGFAGDGGAAAQALLSLPAALAVNSSGIIFIGDLGNLRVRKLTPGEGPSVNHAPVVANIANLTVALGQVVNVTITASDQDNDPVTLQLSGAPAFVTLIDANPANRTSTLRIAPSAAGHVGSLTGLVIAADDGHGGVSQSNAFSITVPSNTANRAPVAQANTLPSSVNAPDSTGVTIQLNGLSSFDPDSDTLNFAWTDNGTVIATSAVAEVKLGLGTHSIVLTISDGRGGVSATAAQSVTVNPPSGLSLSSITPNSGRRGGLVSITVNGSGFTPQTTVNLSGAGTAARTTFVSSTQLTVIVTISSNAFPTTRSISVVNPGGAMATLASSFEIKP